MPSWTLVSGKMHGFERSQSRLWSGEIYQPRRPGEGEKEVLLTYLKQSELTFTKQARDSWLANSTYGRGTSNLRTLLSLYFWTR